jgi:NADPH-dependent ferric siderophore reductase
MQHSENPMPSTLRSPPGVQRVRHDTRMRLLTVRRVMRLTDHLVRVTLGGDALAGFVSAAADDHVKLFFPAPGSTTPVLPAGPPGTQLPPGAPAPIARDYTPRRFDPMRNELDIDFVLHGPGPASEWAAGVQVGQQLGVGGPRGSFVVSGHFDWHLLIGDEAAIPAIARRLEELPADARAQVLIEVAEAGDELPLRAPVATQLRWLHRGTAEPGSPALLLHALASLDLPAGVGYVWIACESSCARRLRQHLIDERGLEREWVKAAGYWKRGTVASHERLDD